MRKLFSSLRCRVSPKSVTLTLMKSCGPFTFSDRSKFKDFKSRCIRGGLRVCMKCIPFAISRAILCLCLNVICGMDLLFSCRTSNKVPPWQNSVTITGCPSSAVAPIKSTRFGWLIWVNASISLWNSRLSFPSTIKLWTLSFLTATSVNLYYA